MALWNTEIPDTFSSEVPEFHLFNPGYILARVVILSIMTSMNIGF